MFFRNENSFPKKVLDKLNIFSNDFSSWEWTDLVCWTQEFKSLLEKHTDQELPVHLLMNLFKTLSSCFRTGLAEGVQFKLFDIFSLLSLSPSVLQQKLVSMILVTFFEVASKEIQLKIIDQLEKLCVDIIKFPVDCILAGLFKGIDEKGEVFEKVKNLVLHFLSKNEKRACSALWRVTISSNNKMPVLVFLKSFKATHNTKQERLALTGLSSGLADPNLRVQRLSLDLLKVYFPLQSIDVEREDKLALLKKALVLSDNREQTVLRRVWEWVFPHEMADEIDSVSLICEAFYELRIELKDKLMIVRIADLICGCEFGLKIFERISIELLIFLIFVDQHSKDLKNFISTIDEFKFVLLEKVLQSIEDFLQMSEDLAYSMANFVVFHGLQNGTFCFGIFEHLVDSIDYLENKTKLFELLESLSHCVNRIPSLDKFSSVVIFYMTKKNDSDLHKKIVQIVKNFENNGLEVQNLLQEVKRKVKISKDTEKYSIIEFFANFLNAPVSLIEMQFIWKKLLRKDEVFDLILKLSKNNKELVNAGLLELIGKGKIGFQAFLKFWDRASCEEIIETISNEAVCVVISLMDEHEDLRPWIHSLDTKAFIIIDLLLVFLLDPVTLRVPANRIYVYANLFDMRGLIQKLENLKVFLSNISSYAMDSLLYTKTQPRFKSFLTLHKLTAETYMQGLVKSLVLYLVTQPFDELTLLSCSCLELVSKTLPQNLTFHVVRGGVRSLEHLIAQNDYTMQVSVMTLISPLLNRLTDQDYTRLYNSRVFTSCLLEGCFSKEAIIRRQWRETVIKTLQMVCNYSSPESFAQYFEPLIKGISHHLVTFKDTSLISTLSQIIKSVFRSKLSSSAIFSTGFLENCIKISADFLVIAGNSYHEKHPTEKVKKILAGFVKKHPQELVESFVAVWNKYCQGKQEFIPVLLVVIHQFQMTLEEILRHLLKTLAKEQKVYKEVQVFITFLIYKLFLQTSIVEGFVGTFTELWTLTLEVLNELLKSAFSEVPALIVKILALISMESEKFYSSSSKVQKKTLKELAGKLFESVFSDIFQIRKLCITLPYPDFQKECEVHELCLKYMIQHAYEVTLFVCDSDISQSVLFLSNCCLNLLLNLPPAKYGKKQATSFIVSVLTYPELDVCEKIRKQVVELVFSESFIKNSSECLHEFSFIVRQVLKSSSALKETFDRVFQEFTDSWFFFKKKSLETDKKQLTRACFLFYSTNWTENRDLLQVITGQLQDCLNQKTLFRHFCVLLKIAFVKLPSNEFLRIWEQLYGKLIIFILQIVEDTRDCSAVLDSLRLIEFFLCAEFQEIYRVLYIFLPEVSVDRLGQAFQPVLLKTFFKDSENVERLNECNFDVKVCKSFVTGYEDVDRFDDLEKIVVSFVYVWRIYLIQPPGLLFVDALEQIEREIHRLFL